MKVKKFHIGIKAVIEDSKKILLVNEVSRFSGYDFRGGKIDEGESWQDGLKRELYEEIGLKNFKTEEILGIFERPDYQDYDEGKASLMIIYYKVSAKVSKIKLSSEHSGFKWVTKKDLKTIKLRNDGVKEMLEKVLKK